MPGWWKIAENSITTRMRDEFEKLVGPVQDTVNVIKGDMKEVKHEVSEIKEAQTTMDQRVAALEKQQQRASWTDDDDFSTTAPSATATQPTFEPKYIDIRGWCKYEDRATEGVARAEAIEMVGELKLMLDESIREHVREVRPQSLRSLSIHVFCTKNFIREIKNSWMDQLTVNGPHPTRRTV